MTTQADIEAVPKRVQRKRTKGWRKPGNAVYVGRGTKWGNVFEVGFFYQLFDYGWSVSSGHHEGFEYCGDKKTATEMFERMIGKESGTWKFRPTVNEINELRGKDLMCWCDLSSPCHADVLLEISNAE